MDVPQPPVTIPCFSCPNRIIESSPRKIHLSLEAPYLQRLLADTNKVFEPNQFICIRCYLHYKRQQDANDHPQDDIVEPNGIIPVLYTPKQQRRCIVCKSTTYRNRVSSKAISGVFLDKRIVVHKGARCCPLHLNAGTEFTDEAMVNLANTSRRHLVSEQTFDELTKNALHIERTGKGMVSFSWSANPNQRLYDRYIGLTPDQFNHLANFIENKLGCRKTLVRRNLAIFLVKLRKGMAQDDIGVLFGISQSEVSLIIESVSQCLVDYFVPVYLGFSHISRLDYKVDHGTILTDVLFDIESDQVACVLDATYLYIEKSSDHAIQKKTFSVHKHANLVKPMIVCAPDGYILASEGCYYADGDNNDASILSAMCTDTEGFLSFFNEGDVILYDRGFRDTLSLCKSLGLRTFMPHYLAKNKSQHTTQEANDSRAVTKCRWVIESVNARIKNKFDFFAKQIRISYLPKLNDFFLIGCALLNAYSSPLAADKEHHIRLSEKILALQNKENVLMNTVISKGYDKRRKGSKKVIDATDNDFQDFPILSIEDLEELSLGSYQIKNAPAYAAKNLQEDSSVEMFYLFEECGLVRFDIDSRYGSKSRRLWIHFRKQLPNESPTEAILGWYCNCRAGARTVGTCSHIASSIWYFGFARHQPYIRKPGSGLAVNIKDAATFSYDEME